MNPVRLALETYRAVTHNRSVYLSVLGISWSWFLGASFLFLLPIFARQVLGAQGSIATVFLSVSCVGIVVGSFLCKRMGGRKLELGLVPFGSIGLSLAAVDLYFATSSLEPVGDQLVGIGAFMNQPGAWRMIIDFFLLAVCGGLFTVPLYTLIRERSEPEIRPRVVAGNNILNVLFMLGSALLLMVLLKTGVTIPQTFLLLGVLNALVAAYIYAVIPEFLLRFFAWIVGNLMYRIRVVGGENLPDDGPALLVANHVTYVDWLIISSAYQRPLRFVMHQRFLELPWVGWAFRDAKVIPIASGRESPEAVQHAFDRIAEELEDGQVVCIFPEGQLTDDGKLGPLKSGTKKILERTPVRVIPVRLDGLWGSYFSRKDNQALRKPFRRFWSRITLAIHPPLEPEQATLETLEGTLSTPTTP